MCQEEKCSIAKEEHNLQNTGIKYSEWILMHTQKQNIEKQKNSSFFKILFHGLLFFFLIPFVQIQLVSNFRGEYTTTRL